MTASQPGSNLSDEEVFAAARPLLNVAARELRDQLDQMLAAVDNRHLVRARVTEFRIKAFRSLRRKAQRKGWSIEEALKQATDLVGCRVVCNNIQDVERAADLLEQALKARGVPVRRQDHISSPKPGGYRAIHLDLRVTVQFGAQKGTVRCEVQIRSMLQDVWGHLTHADVYKEKQPERLRKQAKHLSELLALADKVADEIRSEIAKPRLGKKPKKGAALSRSSAAFLFQRAFGAAAPDYVIEGAIADLESVARPDGLEQALRDDRLKEKLRVAYQEHARWEPESGDYFRWVVRAVGSGREAGLALARADGQEAWGEVEAVARSEMRGALPDTWEEFVAELRGSGKDDDSAAHILTIAEGYGATTECACGTTIVQADALAEAVVDEFELDEDEGIRAREAIEQVVLHSGVETGGFDSSSSCSNCAQQFARD